MRKIIKSFLLTIESILIFIFLFYTTSSIVEHIQKDIKVNEFKNRGIYQEDRSTNKVKFYKIEAHEKIKSFTESGSYIIPGGPADILTTVNTTLPAFNEFVGFYIGGHAALALDDYADYQLAAKNIDDSKSLEATGLYTDRRNTSLIFNRNYFSTNLYNEVIVLRAPLDEAGREEVIANGLSLLGDDYNFSFCFNTTNTSYCSDLISKAFTHVGINLNKDGLTTSIWDLILSNDVYIAYYHYFDSDGVKHIYYLDWEE